MKHRTDKYGRIVLSPGKGHGHRYLALQTRDGVWRAGIEYHGQCGHDSEWCDVTPHASKQEAVERLYALANGADTANTVHTEVSPATTQAALF